MPAIRRIVLQTPPSSTVPRRPDPDSTTDQARGAVQGATTEARASGRHFADEADSGSSPPAYAGASTASYLNCIGSGWVGRGRRRTVRRWGPVSVAGATTWIVLG